MKKNDPYTRDDQTRFTMRIKTELLEKIREDAEKINGQRQNKSNMYWNNISFPFRRSDIFFVIPRKTEFCGKQVKG